MNSAPCPETIAGGSFLLLSPPILRLLVESLVSYCPLLAYDQSLSYIR
jgi:hypothetical protein